MSISNQNRCLFSSKCDGQTRVARSTNACILHSTAIQIRDKWKSEKHLSVDSGTGNDQLSWKRICKNNLDFKLRSKVIFIEVRWVVSVKEEGPGDIPHVTQEAMFSGSQNDQLCWTCICEKGFDFKSESIAVAIEVRWLRVSASQGLAIFHTGLDDKWKSEKHLSADSGTGNDQLSWKRI